MCFNATLGAVPELCLASGGKILYKSSKLFLDMNEYKLNINLLAVAANIEKENSTYHDSISCIDLWCMFIFSRLSTLTWLCKCL